MHNDAEQMDTMRCTGFPYERTWYELDTKAHDRNFLLLLFSVNTQDSVSYSYIDPTFLNLKIKKPCRPGHVCAGIEVVEVVHLVVEVHLVVALAKRRTAFAVRVETIHLGSNIIMKVFWAILQMAHALSIRLLQPCQLLSQKRDVQNNSSELKHLHREILFPPSNQYVMICHSFAWTANFRKKRKVRDSNGLIDQNSNWFQCEQVCVT